MSSAHRITTPCTCMNNTSCNQPKVVLEQEIQAPRGKQCQHGVGTLGLLAVWVKRPNPLILPVVLLFWCKPLFDHNITSLTLLDQNVTSLSVWSKVTSLPVLDQNVTSLPVWSKDCIIACSIQSSEHCLFDQSISIWSKAMYMMNLMSQHWRNSVMRMRIQCVLQITRTI